jgi:hypothetical protein
MPTERIPLQRPRRGHVTPPQWQELWLGPGAKSVFTSREELYDAWQRVRERMLTSLSPGRRPQAFYEFEYDGRRPPYDLERSTLWREGLLTEAEKIALERDWKAEFEKAQAPDFTLNDGHEVLRGELAQAAHYRWADIPRELARRWTAARKRRNGRQPAAPSEEAAAAK